MTKDEIEELKQRLTKVMAAKVLRRIEQLKAGELPDDIWWTFIVLSTAYYHFDTSLVDDATYDKVAEHFGLETGYHLVCEEGIELTKEVLKA